MTFNCNCKGHSQRPFHLVRWTTARQGVEHPALQHDMGVFLHNLSKNKMIYFVFSSNSSSKHKKLRNYEKVLFQWLWLGKASCVNQQWAFTKFKWWDEGHCKQGGENTGVWLICGSRWESLAGKSKVIHNVTLHQPDCLLGQTEDRRRCIGFIPMFKKGELS